MSYVQGTVVRLQADFINHATQQPIDPTEVILTLKDPAGTTTTKRLSTAELEDDPDATGRFYYQLDTSPLTGTWLYQFESVGNEAAVGRAQINVSAKLSASA